MHHSSVNLASAGPWYRLINEAMTANELARRSLPWMPKSFVFIFVGLLQRANRLFQISNLGGGNRTVPVFCQPQKRLGRPV